MLPSIVLAVSLTSSPPQLLTLLKRTHTPHKTNNAAARLYGKLFDLLPTSAVRAQRVHALRASLLRYEWLASYARRWPERVGEFRDELNIAVEMASLLPTQINRLHHG